MSQRFNLKVDEMRQSSPASSGYGQETEIKDHDTYYPTHGNVRDICFIPLSGRMVALNYSYLIAKDANAERTEIILTFSSHTITISGINLESVFFRIMSQHVRLLQCTDARYNGIAGDRAVINDILVSATS